MIATIIVKTDGQQDKYVRYVMTLTKMTMMLAMMMMMMIKMMMMTLAIMMEELNLWQIWKVHTSHHGSTKFWLQNIISHQNLFYHFQIKCWQFWQQQNIVSHSA